jgi:hypothetical protein
VLRTLKDLVFCNVVLGRTCDGSQPKSGEGAHRRWGERGGEALGKREIHVGGPSWGSGRPGGGHRRSSSSPVMCGGTRRSSDEGGRVGLDWKASVRGGCQG